MDGNNKVVLPKEVAEAIERYLNEYDKETLISAKCEAEGEWAYEYRSLDSIDLMTLVTVLVNGYEIGKSPEEKLREYHGQLHGTGMDYAVEHTIKNLSEKYPELANVLGEVTQDDKCPECSGELIANMWPNEDQKPGEYAQITGYTCMECGYERRDCE